MSSMTLVPNSAPFTEEQRAWLNGFLSGFLGLQERVDQQAGMALATGLAPGLLGRMGELQPPAELDSAESDLADEELAEQDVDNAPWRDASLPILERVELAEGSATPVRLMSAMAQLDCGSCGYLCKTYSAAIASGQESNLGLCSPGGKETKQMLKRILQEDKSSNAVGQAVESNASGRGATTQAKPANGHSRSETQQSQPDQANGRWTRQRPYAARLLESRALNGAGSAKDTRHVVIDLGDSGLEYAVGDALGIYPTNCPQLVSAIVAALAAERRTLVRTPTGATKPLELVLQEDYCLRDPSDELLELLSQRIAAPDRQQKLAAYSAEGTPEGFDVLDALHLAHGATISATEFVETLAPLAPRLYSIASSMRQVGRQVHLTVGKVSYENSGRVRQGVASTLLADRLQAGESLRVFVHPNHGGFTIPADPQRPMIMVGPGTGIAPFLAFLQERQAARAEGANWLFFGDQHAASDFLYEQELSNYLASGLLTKLDTAFSRDGGQKVYVQDRMRAGAAELWQWLERGAHFYVCGDAGRMAKDVDRTLRDIIASQAGLSDQEVDGYIKQMVHEKRYVRDVY